MLTAGQSLRAEDDLEALRQLMGPITAVKVAVETKTIDAKEGVPPRQSDRWTFSTGISALAVNYSRYLNQPPHFTGRHPSLVGSDMGVGFDGGAFGNWYAGNTIRILVNGNDIMQRRPADRIEAGAGEDGRLRLAWDLDGGGELSLHVVIPEDGRAIYTVIALEPGSQPVDAIQVRLTAYPGGFGPAHGHPSHRWVLTASGTDDVPPDFVRSDDNPFPILPLTAATPWVFYADRLQNRGALGLLTLAEKRMTGEIRLGDYGVATVLDYPADVRRIHLAFYAFIVTNDAAQSAFQGMLDAETRALRALNP